MNETWRRTLRTFLQAGPAALIVGVLIAFHVINGEQAVAITAFLTPVCAAVYNGLEDAGVPVPVRRAG